MLERLACGELPPKHHVALHGPGQALRYEACLTRGGFEGGYTITYHEHRPQALRAVGDPVAIPLAAAGSGPASLARRHYRTAELLGGTPSGQALPLLYNDDVVIGCRLPDRDDATYQMNAGADELCFALSGNGTLRTPLGDLEFGAGDYVYLPKGLLYRVLCAPGERRHWLSLELSAGFGIPGHFRNPLGQLRMDAPYCHRD
ncbi:MAG TPA: cupin domain-containing protein, partial [Polyangiaceae bacterium]|nr:cupin domain-containing protein [Polyangiaceae bacterium]